MTLQNERQAECFICSALKNNCKIIKNQDENDAICKEDFIKLCTSDTENYISIHNLEEAQKLWKNIDSDGNFSMS